MNSNSDQNSSRESNYRRLAASRVRLVISIPTLTLLLPLATGVIVYWDLFNLTRNASPPLKPVLEATAEDILRGTMHFSLVGGLVGLILALEIVRPIRELTRNVQQVTYGDLTLKPRIPDLGELADLGLSFSRMVNHLQRLFRERNRILESGGPVSLLWLDLSGKIHTTDTAAAELLGIPPEHLAGRPVLEILPPLAHNRDFKAILRGDPSHFPSAPATGREVRRPLSTVIELPGREGSPVLLLGATLALMNDETGRPVGYLLVLRNLTLLRKFHEQMERADRLAALGTFAAGMAHEVRNPLASMKGMVQLLAESADPEQQSEYVRRLDSEIARLESLMSEVLEFAQPEPARPRPTDLNRVVRESLDVASERHQPEARQVSVRLELDPALPPGVVEIRRLHQAIVNLILNAFEAAPDGSEVVIRTRRAADEDSQERPLLIEISNSGPPISPEERERIFEPFYTTKPKGTGLGLPIAYQIITANRGDLEFGCEGGVTTFRVSLPQSPA